MKEPTLDQMVRFLAWKQARCRPLVNYSTWTLVMAYCFSRQTRQFRKEFWREIGIRLRGHRPGP